MHYGFIIHTGLRRLSFSYIIRMALNLEQAQLECLFLKLLLSYMCKAWLITDTDVDIFCYTVVYYNVSFIPELLKGNAFISCTFSAFSFSKYCMPL